MKHASRTMLALVAAVLLVTGLAAQKTDSAQALLRAATDKAVVDGNLNGAIKQYQTIVDTFKTDRAVVATALVHMAECYQKLGDAESSKIYERVLREYGDQKEAVTMARAHLGRGVAAAQQASGQPGVIARQVWTLPSGGGISYGAVSPDGRYIPFADSRLNHELFLHDLRTGTDRRVTNGGSLRAGMPVSEVQYASEWSFSRDGQQLAFSWFVGWKNSTELRVIGLQGAGIPQFRLLFDNPGVESINPQDWSPDGKWVAVYVAKKDSGQIGLLSVQDGSLRILKSTQGIGPERMYFSPDGKYLAYDLPASDTGQRDIFILAADASSEIAAVAHPSNDGPAGWSPDGTRLLFRSDRSGSTDLWALEFAGGKPRGSPELIKRDVRGFTLGMTASGSLYTSVTPGAQSDIQVASFDFAKGQFLSMPTPVVDTFVGTNRAPNWSPDGKYLAYLSMRQPSSEGDPVIGIRTIETGRVRELSPRLGRLRTFSVAWPPDGVSFMATGGDLKGDGGIYKIDGQTGQVSLIVSAENYAENYGVFSSPVLSPDGKTLYYGLRIELAGAAEYVLMKRDLASATETELLRRPVLGPVSLSPDGLYLATASGDPSTKSNTFLIVPTAGGEPKEVMRRAPPQQPGLFVWGPDSQSLLIRIGSGGDKSELWRASVDGTPPVKLDTMVDSNIASVSLHPDGRQIAVAVRTPRKPTEIWVTENFLPSVKTAK